MKITKLTSDSLMGSVTCAFLSFVLCIVLQMPILVNAMPTPDKCSCNFNEQNDRKDGAEVTNAAACFLSLDRQDEWCSFDVESIKYSDKHRRTIRLLRETLDDSPGDLVNVLLDRFKEWTNDGTNENFGMIGEYYTDSSDGREALFNEIARRLDSENDLLLSCVNDFNIERHGGYDELIGDGRLLCGVLSNGWLTLALDFDRFFIFYLLKP